MLEARDRIGGRILTQRNAPLPTPIELGAEFVHGSAPELQRVISAAGIRVADITGHRREPHGRELRRADDYWERLERVMGRLDAKRVHDQSFGAFLARAPGGEKLSAERTLARRYVEGFHAADIDRISARALAEGGTPQGDPAEMAMGRLIDGYDQVPAWLAAPIASRVRLSSPVSSVRWRRGYVDAVDRCRSVISS